MSPLLATSDKSFWHGYTSFYDKHLPRHVDGSIVEFGVFKGNSIRWLLTQFPQAKIFGADILPVQPEWPLDPRVTYVELDQGEDEQVASLVSGVDQLQLIIEDGSHIPRHQSNCLKHGLAALQPGGVYVLEDIHTSHPAHSQYADEFGNGLSQTSLSVLLGIEQLTRQGRSPTHAQVSALADGSHFSVSEIEKLVSQVESIFVYKRATLPDSCWKCGSSTFNYHAFKCECGVDLLSEADSMTIVIKKRLLVDRIIDTQSGERVSPLPGEASLHRVFAATPARHKELSIIASLDDEPATPSQRLMEVALEAFARAWTTELTVFEGRSSMEPRWFEVWPGDHYRLLPALIQTLNAKTVIEIGTFTGMGTLSILQGLAADSKVVTFDVVPWGSFQDTWLREEDFRSGRVNQILADVSAPGGIEAHRALFESAELIFVDGPKDGTTELGILRNLSTLNLRPDVIVFFDDVRLINMIDIWRRIARPKLDITSFGHWSGSGLIDWNGTHAATRSALGSGGAELIAARSIIDQLHKSTSWRSTAPLRALKTWMRRGR